MATVNDLESPIMECWRVVEELITLREGIVSGKLSATDLPTLLESTTKIADYRFDKLFSAFEEVLAARRSK